MLIAAVSLLSVYAAIGMLVSVAFGRPPAGPGFWRLVLLLSLAALLFGVGVRLGAPKEFLPPLGTGAATALIACGLTAIVFGVRKAMEPHRHHALLLYGSAVAGIAAVLLDPVLRTPQQPEGGVVAAAVFATGLATMPLALGSVLLAMILAHWYLVEPRMPIGPLRRVLGLFAATEVLKAGLLIAVVVVHWPQWRVTPGGLMTVMVLGDGLFIAMRATLGVIAPIGLAWLTWKTVQIRSIQSATGILYAAIVLVLFGEITSMVLSLSTGLPY